MKEWIEEQSGPQADARWKPDTRSSPVDAKGQQITPVDRNASQIKPGPVALEEATRKTETGVQEFDMNLSTAKAVEIGRTCLATAECAVVDGGRIGEDLPNGVNFTSNDEDEEGRHDGGICPLSKLSAAMVSG
jgi:hypothetical protein